MSRPDAALALAALYAFDLQRQARIGSVCVDGSGLGAAIYCDIVRRFYRPQVENGNQSLAVGLGGVDALPPDPAMVRPSVERRNGDGEWAWTREIRRVSDTSLAEAVLRNGIMFNAETNVLLSAPATSLARSLDIAGSREIYEGRVQRLVIVETEETRSDAAALDRVIAGWPTSVVLCGPELGEVLNFPTTALDTAFAWARAHPVVEAYRAYRPGAYDVVPHDLAALEYAVHPDSGLFTVSPDGRLALEPVRRDEAIETLIAATAYNPDSESDA